MPTKSRQYPATDCVKLCLLIAIVLHSAQNFDTVISSDKTLLQVLRENSDYTKLPKTNVDYITDAKDMKAKQKAYLDLDQSTVIWQDSGNEIRSYAVIYVLIDTTL